MIMALLESLAEGGTKGILEGIGTAAVRIREAITGEAVIDPNKKAELLAKTLEIENATALAQIAVNQAEAGSPSLFKGGWRPAVGWCCVLALFFEFILRPLLPWGFGLLTKVPPPPLPTLDTGMLFNLMFGMLGLGGLRTVEKIRGVSS
jgi:hypothetical protein